MSKLTPTKIGHGGGGGGVGSLSDRLREKASFDDDNKPDFRELDLGSPVSPVHTRPSGLVGAAVSSSSSSSESVPGRVASNPSSRRPTESSSHSSELSGSSSSSPKATESVRRNFKSTGHVRSDSSQFCGGSVTSPPAPVSVLPAGNIYPSGKILKTGMNTKPGPRRDVLGTGSGHYGHGSIMKCTGLGTANAVSKFSISGGFDGNSMINNGGDFMVEKGMESRDPEEVKRIGNEMYKTGNFADASRLYDRAITLSPGNASYRTNRAAALSGFGRLGEAVQECEAAVKLDPGYSRAHQRLGSLFIRLGMVDIARKHLCFPGQQPDPAELQKLQDVEKHLKKCSDARRVCDWKRALRECDASVAAGADSSPQLSACRAESLLKLQRVEDADVMLSNTSRLDSWSISISQSKFFGMVSEAYSLYVRAQIEMSLGRFDNAVAVAEKAGKIDPHNAEVAQLLSNVRWVARARIRGNDLFKSERFTEACAAYEDGLRLDPLNSVLYCNRAACWFKIGQLARAIEDCNQALRFQPGYTKALLRRAVSNYKLGRWAEAVEDYRALRKALPDDNEIAKSLFHAQVVLRKSRGEEVHNMKFGGEVEQVSGIKQFRAAISSPGASMVFFKASSNQECSEISWFVDKLCHRYPSVSFIKVDIEESPAVADMENVPIVPAFKIYKNSNQLKEMICPTHQVLECTVRHYSC